MIFSQCKTRPGLQVGEGGAAGEYKSTCRPWISAGETETCGQDEFYTMIFSRRKTRPGRCDCSRRTGACGMKEETPRR
eukprot:g56933.t1